MNLYFSNHQSVYIYLRNDCALWVLWFESAEMLVVVLLWVRSPPAPGGSPSPMALLSAWLSLSTHSMLPRGVELQGGSRFCCGLLRHTAWRGTQTGARPESRTRVSGPQRKAAWWDRTDRSLSIHRLIAMKPSSRAPGLWTLAKLFTFHFLKNVLLRNRGGDCKGSGPQ